MIFYHLDLYPRTDPKDGVRIRRLSDLQREEIRASANGTGSAVLAMRGTSDDAEALSPDGLEYLRLVREDSDVVDGATLSGHDEKCVHGLFLDSPGDYLALSRERKQLLTLNATGTLAYLEREVMWSHTYLDGVGAMDPFDQIWRLHAAGDWSGGNHLGAMLWRVMVEALAFQSGAYQHRHADGATYTDTHPDDDKLESAVGAVTLTFDQFEDSSGNPWTKTSGDFIAQVGESILAVVRRLVALGLYVYLDPDTFELSAWEIANHGRDRTGVAWAADVVRFQAPIGQAIETGNIKSDAVRGTTPRIRRTAILAGGGDDIYATSSQAGDVPWHGYRSSESADVAALEAVATRELAARNDAADTARVRIRLGNDPENGAYLPLEAEGVLPDDRATVNSGALAWDWDEQTLPVAGVVLRHRRGGDWEAFVDLGSSFTSAASRAFQGPQTAAHTHPKICRDTPSSTPTTVLDTAFGESGASFTTPFNILSSAEDQYLIVGVGFNGPDWSSGATVDSVTWKPDVGDAGQNQALSFLGRKVGSLITMEIWGLANPTPAVSGPVIHTSSGTSSDRTVMGAVLVEGTDQAPTIGTGGAGTGTASSDSVASDAADLVLNWASIREEDPLTAALGLTELAEYQLGSASSRISIAVGSEVAAGAETSGWTHASFSWVSMSAAFAGEAGADTCIHGGPAANSGDASQVCGKCVAAGNHEHDYVAAGGTTGQVLKKASDTDWDTEWEDESGGSPTDATYLVTAAHADLSAEVVVGATPGGELGGTWAAPTVDATHSGSTHSASTDTHIADASDAHDASAISALDAGGYFTGTDVEAQLQELGAAGDIADALSAKASGSGDVTTTASLADVTGATLSLDAGTYVVVGIFDTLVNNASNDRTFEGHLDVGGVDENDYANLVAPGLVNVRATVAQSWRLVLASTTTVKLRTLHSGGTVGDFTVKSTNTTLTAYRAGGAGQFSFPGSTVNRGLDQNRNTGGAFQYAYQPVRIWRPIKIDSVLWDIRIAGDYTLTICDSEGTVLQTVAVTGIGAGAVDVVYACADRVYLPGIYQFRLTKVGATATWSDFNSAADQRFVAFDYIDGFYYGGSLNAFRGPFRIVYKDSLFTE